jgi:8-oxo-dGTP pyrophosphatase MutT (NUDIX family)
MQQPKVELLYWEGCPSHPQALAALREAMEELGLDSHAVEVRHVATDENAEAEGFVGSPTIRVDGVDVVDPGDEPTALNCRIYHRADGRISPLPDPADVRSALHNAITTRSRS